MFPTFGNKAVGCLLFASLIVVAATPALCQGSQVPATSSTSGSSPSSKESQESQKGGSATGPARAAIYDSGHRPITAGGFVKDGPVIFKDISESAGINSWHHRMGNPQKEFILDTIGSGVALLDYDNDGWLDIYLVNGSTYEALAGTAEAPHAALFHNNHDGTFTDVTAKAGVANDRWGYGVAVGDIDNDGWPDLYVANFGKNRLYHNNHDGTFTDIGEKAGVTLGNWSTGPSFGDYDGDGLLDIFVPGYVHWDVNNAPVSGSKLMGFFACQFRGATTMCGPRGLVGEQDHLFHNNGDGTFTDVSEKAGVSDKDRYYGFSSTFVDVNHDGKVDLVVTNDSSPNYLYMNNGDGTFEDASYYSGFALNQNARESASMGLAVGDYLNNGSVDLFATGFSDDYDTLFRNDGEGNFSEISSKMGVGEITYPFLSWGTQFIDYDNDGWKDLLTVSGHVYPVVDQHDWGTTWAQRPLLFHNVNKGKKFEIMPATEGTGLSDVIPARGAAFGDLFNDGKIDVVINCIDHTPVLLRNVNADTNHWVGIKLVGGPKGPRDAIGATVFVTAGGIRQRADVMSGGSFESSNDQRVHFGLGTAAAIDAVEIHWPGGAIEHVSLPAVDRFFVVEQGKGVVPSIYDSLAKTTASTQSAR